MAETNYPNILKSNRKDGTLANTDNIHDKDTGKKQSFLNKLFSDAIAAVDDKIKEAISKIQNFIIIEDDDYNLLTEYEKDVPYLIYEAIDYVLVDKPIDRTFDFDGLVHTLASTDAYSVSGTGGAIAGVYTFVLTLNFGYKWADGTKTNLVVTYTINPKVVDNVWRFGDKFPIRFSNSIWHFGDKFPIVFSNNK